MAAGEPTFLKNRVAAKCCLYLTATPMPVVFAETALQECGEILQVCDAARRPGTESDCAAA